MVGLGVIAAVVVALVLVSRLRYFRHLVLTAHDHPPALRRACRVCGAPAVHAIWHSRASSYLRPFGPTETEAWCQTHYEQVLARRQAPPSRPAT
jgi:hypothetical protein